MKFIKNKSAWLHASLALLGGYAITAAFAILVASVLPLPRADAVLIATIASFVVYVLVVLATYARWREGFRQSMAWLHTWSGLLMGWLLFIIFVTGTASYYRNEITRWMTPEADASAPPQNALQLAVDELSVRAPDSNRWFINYPNERDQSLIISWRESAGHVLPTSHSMHWNAAETAFVPVRQTRGGDFIYRFHFDLSIPDQWGEWLVGIATLSMLVALVSGVIIHKRIFKDFFTFRRTGAYQRSWLDFHNVTSVLALPFHFMIAFTGLVTLMFLYMPWAQERIYGEDQHLFSMEAFKNIAAPQPSGVPGNLVDMERIVTSTETIWGQNSFHRVIVYNPGDASSIVEMRPSYSDRISLNHSKLLFHGATGELAEDIHGFGPGVRLRGELIGLHVARFADQGLRALFFLFGLAGTAMIGTGLVLWTVKRDRRRNNDTARGLWFVQRLNVALIPGSFTAVAIYLLSNRLTPVDIVGRDLIEVSAFLLTLLLLSLYVLVRPLRLAWVEQCWIAAAAFFAVPVSNMLMTDRGLLQSLIKGDMFFLVFDLSMLGFSLIFAMTALYLRRKLLIAPVTFSKSLGAAK